MKRLRLETLEDREVPASFRFDNLFSNLWSNPNNWFLSDGPDADWKPDADDAVVIPYGELCHFDVGEDLAIGSLQLYNTASLDLSYATAAGVTLTVGGGNWPASNVGGQNPALGLATISATKTLWPDGTLTGTPADIVFTGRNHHVTTNNAYFNMVTRDAADAVAWRGDVTFVNNRTRVAGVLHAHADVVVGDGTFANRSAAEVAGQYDMGQAGTLRATANSGLELLSGKIKSVNPDIPVVNDGTIQVRTAGLQQTFEVVPGILNGPGSGIRLVSGRLVAHTEAASSPAEVVIWEGAGWDSSATLLCPAGQTFAADSVHFVDYDAGEHQGVGMWGEFAFGPASTQKFHTFAYPKTGAYQDDWLSWDWHAAATTTPAGASVVAMATDAWAAGWTSSWGTIWWEIHVAQNGTVTHPTLTISDGVYLADMPDVFVETFGRSPDPGTNVALIRNESPSAAVFDWASVTFLSFSGATGWEQWNPDPDHWGVWVPPPPPPPPPPPGGGEG
jgi:hypothetical protein